MEKRPESVRASWQALAFTVHISDGPFILDSIAVPVFVIIG